MFIHHWYLVNICSLFQILFQRGISHLAQMNKSKYFFNENFRNLGGYTVNNNTVIGVCEDNML